MKTIDLENLLARYSSRTASELDQYARALRAVGLLPTGGRGRQVPEIDPTHAASLLSAAALGLPPAETAAAVATYAALTPSDGERFGFAGAQTFGEALTMLLTDPHGELGLHSIEICRTWPLATIILHNGQRYAFGYQKPTDAGLTGNRPMAEFTRLQGWLILKLAGDLDPESETRGGWTADRGGADE